MDVLYNMEKSVALGAALLDVKVPGWEKTVLGRINDGLFEMHQWDHCIAGSVEIIEYYGSIRADGSKRQDTMLVFNGMELVSDDWSVILGFIPGRPGLPLMHEDGSPNEGDEELYDMLELYWYAEIDKRLGTKLVEQVEEETANSDPSQ